MRALAWSLIETVIQAHLEQCIPQGFPGPQFRLVGLSKRHTNSKSRTQNGLSEQPRYKTENEKLTVDSIARYVVLDSKNVLISVNFYFQAWVSHVDCG
jgi:hypothetical protein